MFTNVNSKVISNITENNKLKRVVEHFPHFINPLSGSFSLNIHDVHLFKNRKIITVNGRIKYNIPLYIKI